MRRVGTEVLVIGGGSSGAGVALDAVLRGFKTLLVEKGDLTHGTTGRFHGLLHSGARYAVSDLQAARDCISENRIVRRILPQAVEDTGGLFLLLVQDDPLYAEQWLRACSDAGIVVEEVAIEEALRDEPLINPAARRAFRVPDASVDSFVAVRTMARVIRSEGGAVWTRHRVDGFEIEEGRMLGAYLSDQMSGEQIHVRADVIVNATGAWAGGVAAMAKCEVNLTLRKGTQVAYASRVVNKVVSRCAPLGDGDILVPVGTVAVMGTTSVPVDNPDRYAIEHEDVDKLARRGMELVPQLAQARALRAWAGVRPLYQPEETGGDPYAGPRRGITRQHAVIDHARRDGVSRFITLVGGKFTTYRLMAEETVNLVCEKLTTSRPCRTADSILIDERQPKVFALGDRSGGAGRQ